MCSEMHSEVLPTVLCVQACLGLTHWPMAMPMSWIEWLPASPTNGNVRPIQWCDSSASLLSISWWLTRPDLHTLTPCIFCKFYLWSRINLIKGIQCKRYDDDVISGRWSHMIGEQTVSTRVLYENLPSNSVPQQHRSTFKYYRFAMHTVCSVEDMRQIITFLFSVSGIFAIKVRFAQSYVANQGIVFVVYLEIKKISSWLKFWAFFISAAGENWIRTLDLTGKVPGGPSELFIQQFGDSEGISLFVFGKKKHYAIWYLNHTMPTFSTVIRISKPAFHLLI